MAILKRRSAEVAPLGVAPAGVLVEPMPPALSDAELADHLVAAGILPRAKVTEASLQLAASGTSLARLLVELGALDERDMARAYAQIFALDYTDLRGVDPAASALQLVPEHLAQDTAVLPLRLLDSGSLEVAVADPGYTAGLTAIARSAGRPLIVRVAPQSAVYRLIATSYRGLLDVGTLVQAFESTDALRRSAAAVSHSADPDDAPVIQLVTQILTKALRDRASDIHVEPQNERVRIRYRIDGALHDVLALPGAIGPAVVSRLKIMAGMNIADRRRAQDGQMAVTLDGRELDVRLNTCPTVWGEKAVLRLLDRTRVVYRLDELGMRERTHEAFIHLVRSPVGMVICAGPTGSGKTTTLYATLAEVNQTERNVTTIEDPVEYVFPSLTQIQINEATGLTFASGLRAILRQDPDVILVGEIRDSETARIAIESALTGHLVLSSLHATDACAALQRLVDMGIEAFLVASTVTGMASQRLFRRICEYCKLPDTPRADEVAFHAAHAHPDAGPLTRLWRSQGCENCSNTGFRDRIGVFELVVMSEGIKAVMAAGGTTDELRRVAAAEGTRFLLQEALALVSDGRTSLDEVTRNVYGG
ncbi:MAG: GspE/PulE family protein [Sporichthyaceae bacterium]